MNRKALPILLFASLALGANAQSNIATVTPNDSSDIFNLSIEELMNVKVTTASKMSQNASKAAATLVVVTEDQINSRGYQSLLDVLRDLPDFKIEENSSSEGNRITIRGISGQDKFVIMLDGVRISSPTNEMIPVFANYPVNLAEQIEIVYGPASALYGADAVSGIINIISKKAKIEDNLTVKASSIAGSYGYTSSQAFINKKVSDDLNITVSGQYLYDNQADASKVYTDNKELKLDNSVYNNGMLNTRFGPMKANTPIYEAPLKGYNLYGSIRFKDFSFSAISTFSQNSSSIGYNTANALYNKDAFIARTVNMFNAQHMKQVGKFTFTSLLMGSKYSTDPNSNYQNVYVGLQKGYKYDVGSMLKIEEQINYNLNEKVAIIGGVTQEMFNSVPKGGDLEAPVNTSTNINGVYLGSRSYYNPDGIQAQLYNLSYTNTGVYLQGQVTPAKAISITLGGRYDHNSRFGTTINPRAGIVLSPTEKTTIKVLYNQAFLAPSPYIAYQHYGSFATADSGKTYTSSFWHLPNPNLKPIKSKNVELSLRQFIGSNFSVTLSSYVTFLTDLVVRTGDLNNLYNGEFLGNKIGYIETFSNQGKQTNYGGSFTVNHATLVGKAKINSYLIASYVDGKVDYQTSNNETKRVQIENISPLIFRIGTDIYYNKLTSSVRLIQVGDQRINLFKDATNPDVRQTIAGYTMLNLSVKYKVYKGASIFVNIDNALNQKYYNISTELNPVNSEVLTKAPQNPIRVAGGLSFIF